MNKLTVVASLALWATAALAQSAGLETRARADVKGYFAKNGAASRLDINWAAAETQELKSPKGRSFTAVVFSERNGPGAGFAIYEHLKDNDVPKRQVAGWSKNVAEDFSCWQAQLEREKVPGTRPFMCSN